MQKDLKKCFKWLRMTVKAKKRIISFFSQSFRTFSFFFSYFTLLCVITDLTFLGFFILLCRVSQLSLLPSSSHSNLSHSASPPSATQTGLSQGPTFIISSVFSAHDSALSHNKQVRGPRQRSTPLTTEHQTFT